MAHLGGGGAGRQLVHTGRHARASPALIGIAAVVAAGSTTLAAARCRTTAACTPAAACSTECSVSGLCLSLPPNARSFGPALPCDAILYGSVQLSPAERRLVCCPWRQLKSMIRT